MEMIGMALKQSHLAAAITKLLNLIAFFVCLFEHFVGPMGPLGLMGPIVPREIHGPIGCMDINEH